MKSDSIPNVGLAHSLPAPDAVQASQDSPRLPPWWQGNEQDYRHLHDARREIHSRDCRMAKKARTTILASSLAAIVLYGLDLVGACVVAGVSCAGLAAAAFLLAATGLWILDRRLAQQFRDAKLHAYLWNELVSAVRKGRIDLAAIEFRPPFETEVEGLLRRQLTVVWEFLASQGNVTLHLPLLNHGVTLTRA